MTAPPAGSNLLAQDLFERAGVNGWGTADLGGAWTTSGVASRYTVEGGAGVMTFANSTSLQASLPGVSSANTKLSASFSVDKVANAQYISFVGRQVGAEQYLLRVRTATDGSVILHVMRGGTAIGAAYNVPGLTVTPGAVYNVSFQVTGASPTTLAGKIWAAGTTEPAAWQISRTDSTASMQTAGTTA
ncbi:hypothetical protein QL996_16650, partial [Planococcus sp. APC 4015]|nr:hypothetical protein [Planococcus sp. APC 4015]